MQVVMVTLENRVRFQVDLNVQVTGRPTVDAGFTFTRQTNAIPFINTCGNAHRQGFMFLDPAFTVAMRTRVRDDTPRSMATWTGLLNREKTLLHADLSVPSAGWTCDGFGAWLCSSTVARLAF